MTPAEITETLAALKESQATIAIHLGVWCRSPSDAVLARLADARAEEARLFDLVLWRSQKPGPKGPHVRKDGEVDRRWSNGRSRARV